MGRNRVCEACGAREWFRKGFFANFPLDESRCKEWVRLCGKEDLALLPIEKLNQIFDKKDFNRKGNRLKKKAIPKLKLIAAPLADYMLEDFPLHVASKQITVQPSLSTRPLDGSSKPSFLGPSTSSSSIVSDHATVVQPCRPWTMKTSMIRDSFRSSRFCSFAFVFVTFDLVSSFIVNKTWFKRNFVK